MKRSFLFLICLFISTFIFAQNLISTQPHFGSANDAVISNSNALYTVGNDGFVIKWTSDFQGEHYQISDLEIKLIDASPNGRDIAIYETDGYSINRISVWDWSTKKRKMVKRLSDNVTTLKFSEKGTYLMIGTNSIDGIIYLDANRGTVLRKIKETPGMVSMTLTSTSENTSIMYTPLGKLIYTNLKTGATKESFSVETNLTQPTLFNNNLFFAGYKENYIYIYSAPIGKLLAKIYAKDAIFASSKNEPNLYFVVKDNRNYTLKMIQTETQNVYQTAYTVKTFYPESRPELTKLFIADNNFYALCNDGTLQTMSIQADTNIVGLTNISQKVYSNILDIATIGEDFYFLTDKNVFASSYHDKSIVSITNNSGYSNIIGTTDSLIFYSSKKAMNLVAKSISMPNKEEILYKPNAPIKTLHQKDNLLLVIEGSSKVVLVDLNKKTAKTVYTGVGIQDALLFSENDLYVAKTSASEPKSTLIHVDVNTQETVALDVDGEVAFSISPNENSSVFYGVSLFSGNSKHSDIFGYYPDSKRYTTIFQWSEEDTEAFTYFCNGQLYTNIGKTEIRSLNLSTRKSVVLKRFASIPQKIIGNSSLMVVLNKDGSITWYNAAQNTLYANWYVKTDGSWIEY